MLNQKGAFAMRKLSIHTPEGVQDTLFEECHHKRLVESDVMNVFEGCGYFEVETPSYEYYDVFDGLDGIEAEKCFRFFDRQGRILTLRPDLTTPISRIMATKLENDGFPMRISYLGNAFRYEDVEKGGRQREFTQSGIELLNDPSSEADAEIIITTIKALLAAGLEEFKIEIGQVMFFRGLMEEAKIEKNLMAQTVDCINMKDGFGLNALLESIPLSAEKKEILNQITLASGGAELLDQLAEYPLNATSRGALSNLKEVYGIIEEYGFEKYVSIDLGMIQSLKYYTGITFKGFTYGVGFPICGGGRYDKLSKKFGAEISATGAAISISRLASSLYYQKKDYEKVREDVLIAYAENKRKEAIFLADTLRHDGYCVVMKKADAPDREYIAKREIPSAIFLLEDGRVELFDGTESEFTTYEELIKEEDIHPCDI